MPGRLSQYPKFEAYVLRVQSTENRLPEMNEVRIRCGFKIKAAGEYRKRLLTERGIELKDNSPRYRGTGTRQSAHKPEDMARWVTAREQETGAPVLLSTFAAHFGLSALQTTVARNTLQRTYAIVLADAPPSPLPPPEPDPVDTSDPDPSEPVDALTRTPRKPEDCFLGIRLAVFIGDQLTAYLVNENIVRKRVKRPGALANWLASKHVCVYQR